MVGSEFTAVETGSGHADESLATGSMVPLLASVLLWPPHSQGYSSWSFYSHTQPV